MGLLGKAAMVAWHDVNEGAGEAHDEWHSHEHMAERLRIPGFRRGRRCRAIDGRPGWFLMYEVDDLAVLTSPVYLERLNRPTEWSRRVIPTITGMNRTLATVEHSDGIGVGSFAGVARFTLPEGDSGAELKVRFQERAAGIVKERGIVGAHLLRGDVAASSIDTREKSLRSQPDAVADWVALIEGYGDDQTASAVGSALDSLGVAQRADSGLYRLAHLVTEADV